MILLFELSCQLNIQSVDLRIGQHCLILLINTALETMKIEGYKAYSFPEPFPNLTELTIADNPTLPWHELREKMPQLEDLWIENTRTIPNTITLPTTVTNIRCENCSNIPRLFGQLTSVTHLILDNCQGEVTISNQNLVSLNAESNIPFHIPQPLTQLAWLGLEYNPMLPYTQLEMLMPQLKDLVVWENVQINTQTRLPTTVTDIYFAPYDGSSYINIANLDQLTRLGKEFKYDVRYRMKLMMK